MHPSLVENIPNGREGVSTVLGIRGQSSRKPAVRKRTAAHPELFSRLADQLLLGTSPEIIESSADQRPDEAM